MPLTPEEEIKKLKADLEKANGATEKAKTDAEKATADAEKLKADLEKANAKIEASEKASPNLPPVPADAAPVESEAKSTYTVLTPPEGTTAWVHKGIFYTAGQKIEILPSIAKQLAAAKIISL